MLTIRTDPVKGAILRMMIDAARSLNNADLADTGPMYRVRCTTDGTEFDTFEDELDPAPPTSDDEES